MAELRNGRFVRRSIFENCFTTASGLTLSHSIWDICQKMRVGQWDMGQAAQQKWTPDAKSGFRLRIGQLPSCRVKRSAI
jgi:hypothetical protein